MKIYVTSQTKIKDIKKVFNNTFRFLSLDFVNPAFLSGDKSNNKEKLNDDSELLNVNNQIHEGMFEINGRQPVTEVAEILKANLHITIQILRRSGDLFTDNITSSQLSLDKQNEIGRHAYYRLYDEEVLL